MAIDRVGSARTEVVLSRGEVTLRGTATGDGPAVLLLHAGGERRDVWSPVMGPLNEREFRTVAFDLRGHGESSGAATSLQPIAEDVRAMIGRERPPVVVVGASLGGFAAIAATADPRVAQRVAGLVLVDVVPDPDPVHVRQWLAEHAPRAGRQELVDDILAQGPDLLAMATRFEGPMLLVRGGESALSDADVDRLQAAIRELTIVDVPGAGHLVARDAPDALARIIGEHLSIWLPATDPR